MLIQQQQMPYDHQMHIADGVLRGALAVPVQP